MEKQSSNVWATLSFVCLFMGVAVWIPNIIFQYGYSYWLLTFILNPLGTVFGYIGKSKFGMAANILITFSFFIFMFLGYMIFGMLGGKP
ncbi:hypothetical protein [Salipaludibacillus aurantiacus]|uniref:Uncharacterized protein n=1 Tax=Salipaludibacillus aurantiacus TaxID=1601833 RepID=A0A1H9VZP6_9BACI|nr:hypothetical protein [Salipaludibacillus aurantiacus]SES27112.1 hypothetical protein SAMN05518684_11394 [Salipaludibacillus aurantiacus]